MFDKLWVDLVRNPRLRVGLALIVAVLWFYGVLALRDVSESRLQSFQAAAGKLARVQAMAKQGDWVDRVTEVTTLQADLESGLWRGDTLGLSRAALQDFLSQQMRLAVVGRPLITLGNDEEVPPSSAEANSATNDLWKVKAKLNFEFTLESFNSLLLRLESHPQHLVVESLHVVKEPAPRVELVVVAYFQKPGESTPLEPGATKPPAALAPAAAPAARPAMAASVPGPASGRSPVKQ